MADFTANQIERVGTATSPVVTPQNTAVDNSVANLISGLGQAASMGVVLTAEERVRSVQEEATEASRLVADEATAVVSKLNKAETGGANPRMTHMKRLAQYKVLSAKYGSNPILLAEVDKAFAKDGNPLKLQQEIEVAAQKKIINDQIERDNKQYDEALNLVPNYDTSGRLRSREDIMQDYHVRKANDERRIAILSQIMSKKDAEDLTEQGLAEEYYKVTSLTTDSIQTMMQEVSKLESDRIKGIIPLDQMDNAIRSVSSQIDTFETTLRSAYAGKPKAMAMFEKHILPQIDAARNILKQNFGDDLTYSDQAMKRMQDTEKMIKSLTNIGLLNDKTIRQVSGMTDLLGPDTTIMVLNKDVENKGKMLEGLVSAMNGQLPQDAQIQALIASIIPQMKAPRIDKDGRIIEPEESKIKRDNLTATSIEAQSELVEGSQVNQVYVAENYAKTVDAWEDMDEGPDKNRALSDLVNAGYRAATGLASDWENQFQFYRVDWNPTTQKYVAVQTGDSLSAARKAQEKLKGTAMMFPASRDVMVDEKEKREITKYVGLLNELRRNMDRLPQNSFDMEAMSVEINARLGITNPGTASGMDAKSASSKSQSALDRANDNLNKITGGDSTNPKELDPHTESKELLKKYEGEGSEAYLDSTGNLTAGYGHKITGAESHIKEGDKIDEATRDEWFAKDYARAKKGADILMEEYGIRGEPVVEEVITRMVFQMGVGGVGSFDKFLSAIAAKDYNTAADEMLKSKWFKQTPKRAGEEAERIRSLANAE